MSNATGQPGDRAQPANAIGLAGLTQPRGQTGSHPVVEPVVRPPAPPRDAVLQARPKQDLEAVAAPRGARQLHPVTFTGTGSEYFRIWIVNLLLTFVTLGIYFPWAKVRKLRYFYGNTHIAGHALDFHGEPRRMLRGYAIVSALFFAYSMAGNVSPIAGGIALLILAAIWPALLRAGQRFRLAQTSWRGLRFSFSGTTGDAYRSLLPLALPAAVLLGLGAMVPATEDPAPTQVAASPVDWAIFATLLSATLLAPVMWWSLKRFQHGNYNLGRVHARFTAGPGSFYAIFLKSILLTMLVGAVIGVGLALFMGGGALMSIIGGEGGKRLSPWLIGLMVALAAVAYLSIFWITQPYLVARLQNLVWNRTDSSTIGFESRLRYRSLLLLGFKNWLLMIFTLGLYWPFAAVAMARLRLEAVTVVAHRDLDGVVQDAQEGVKDATGDAAGDIFDIDIGM